MTQDRSIKSGRLKQRDQERDRAWRRQVEAERREREQTKDQSSKAKR
jgi:hypothetical protein